MLLIDRPEMQFKFSNKIISLRFNFRLFYDIYCCLKDTTIAAIFNQKNSDVFDVLNDIDRDKMALILACASKEVNKYYLKLIDHIKERTEEEFKYYLELMSIAYITDMIYEEPNKEKEETSKEEKTDKLEFDDWFNYFYSAAIDVLNMSLKEFLDSTPAQLKERIYRYKVMHININIESYVKTHCTSDKQTNNKQNDNEVIEVSSFDEFIQKI